MTRREVWILGGAVAVGAVARFATLDLQSFQHDEAVMAGRVIQRASGTRSTKSSTASAAAAPLSPLLGMVAAVLDERSTVLIVS